MKLRRSVALLVLLAASGCDLLLGGSYTVSDLDEYEDHIAGADLYSKHQVGLLQFPCETLREAWVARAQA